MQAIAKLVNLMHVYKLSIRPKKANYNHRTNKYIYKLQTKPIIYEAGLLQQHFCTHQKNM